MHLLQLQHLTQNYIQEKSMYLSISKRVDRIHVQSLQTSLSFRLTFFIRYLNMRFHCTKDVREYIFLIARGVKVLFLKKLSGGQ